MSRRAIQQVLAPSRAAVAPLPAAIGASARLLHSSPSVSKLLPSADDDTAKKGSNTFLGALLYGSQEAKQEGLVSSDKVQHSKLVGRGKYVHEKVTHNVKCDRRDEYVEAAEKYYRKIMERGAELGGIKLTGSWETVVGTVGEFNHILEFDGYKAFDTAMRTLRRDEEMRALESAILPLINSRQHQLISEFSFWPSSPPRDSGYPNGGIFEMRSYQLQPGGLLEWEGAWRRGLEARRRFAQPVGAFFAQVGRLHEVHHIWQYPDMETRKATREQAWSVGHWSDTVQETVKLAQSMTASIMLPCSWSPLR